jgi:hypothetical protein
VIYTSTRKTEVPSSATNLLASILDILRAPLTITFLKMIGRLDLNVVWIAVMALPLLFLAILEAFCEHHSYCFRSALCSADCNAQPRLGLCGLPMKLSCRSSGWDYYLNHWKKNSCQKLSSSMNRFDKTMRA